MKNLDPKKQRWMRVRIVLLAVGLLAFAGVVVRRAYSLQIEQGPELAEMASSQHMRSVRLAPKRGTIYDRHGAELAVSVDVESIWANPRVFQSSGGDPDQAATLLAAQLGVDRDRVAERLRSRRYFVWIKRRVTPEEAARVRAFELPGVYMSEEARRYYPNRQLAAHILGFANVDGHGIEGLELSLEDRLRGSVEPVPAVRDRRGRIVFSERLLDGRAAQGDDVYLTIDKTIQHIAERELELGVRTAEARAGTIVVMDPRTGEILAMANYPTFNPNDPGSAPPANRRNRAITDRFEPGSTVKPMTIAAAFAANVITPEQEIDCENGEMAVADKVIHDSHRWGILTPAEILAHSSNIGTAKIGFLLGRRRLYRAFRRFGFGAPTGLPLPGETGGILRHYQRWYDMDLATISFGQAMSVTTVQMAAAMGAIANGGRLMRPTLIRRVVDGRGEVVEEAVPRVRRQVVPQRTARLIADMLTAVTGAGGTGVDAAIDGYLVAGKTGTAQKADYQHGGYAENRWIASFVGFVPAQDPRLVIAVVVDEPVIEHYGGVVAGPIFRRVGEAALRHLGVPAQTGGEVLAEYEQRARRVRLERERLERETLRARRQARREVRALRRQGQPIPEELARVAGLEEEEEGRGEGEEEARSPGPDEVIVPDLGGVSARGAVITARTLGLDLEVHGSGVVTAQDPEPGAIAARGSTLALTLSAPDFASLDAPEEGESEGGDEAEAEAEPAAPAEPAEPRELAGPSRPARPRARRRPR